MLYSFFVGSVPGYDAHAESGADVTGYPVTGVWNNQTERTMRYDLECSTDEQARMIGYALCRITGNEAVLIKRAATPGDDTRSMGSPVRFRCGLEVRYSGNRTLYSASGLARCTDPAGWVLTPDARGEFVAYLAWGDATVTPVTD
jgi:hypothetical protein